jgi:hypothetical protein
MTTTQQTAAIYEAMGIEYLPEGHFHPDNPIGQTFPPIDHNFLASAREKLLVTEDKQRDFIRELDKAVGFPDNIWGYKLLYAYFNSTPQQQLTALVKALNLWTD